MSTKWGPHSALVVCGVLAGALSLTSVMAVFVVTSIVAAMTPVPVVVHTITTPSCAAGYVALTYDDGPTEVTGQLSAALAKHGLHATFFEMGYKIHDMPGVVRDVHAQGHEIGVHTWDHPRLTEIDPGVVAWQIRSTVAEIKAATGDAPTLFRPPYGATNPAIRAEAARQGLTEVIWTSDPDDWVEGETAEHTDDLIANVKAGDVILMHDADIKAVKTVPLIANTLAAKDLCAGRIVASNTPVPVWEGLTYNAAVIAWDER